ncbi:tyrosine protein kinase [Brevibacillus brevis]|uniref:CpsD/CapB family tyrosine-protein kinase n=1 Tax=Brevibacillus brevis TaxID=1393 RepID=UPI000B3A3644|nr:CpsD/CapB family tyrosine-protein kinase [Brevibacillus brevis]OUQ88305.1 tyrosine protein kinase [Brevibacillus brevis]
MSMRRQKPDDRYQKLIAHWEPLSPLVEGYRTLRLNIQFSMGDKPMQTILVTSPGASEGKTITAANLSLMMAKDHKKTVLLDFDLRNPRVHFTFDMPNLYGISSYFSDMCQIPDIIQPSGVSELSIITAGPIPHNPAEMLGTPRLLELMDYLRHNYDFVIVDSPPLIVSDAMVLAREMDGCVMVVDASKTKRDSAVKAVEQLKAAGANLLGVVLNNKKVGKREGYYGYGYNA